MKNIEELLEEIQVHPPGMWNNELTGLIIDSWYAVSNNKGIIAYFGEETDAYMFRLDYINKILNN